MWGASMGVPESTPSFIVGRMCQIIEMLGLKEGQEKATKDSIKREIYNAFSPDQGCYYIDSELTTVIKLMKDKEEKYCYEKGTPTGTYGMYDLIKTTEETKRHKPKEQNSKSSLIIHSPLHTAFNLCITPTYR